MDKKRLDLIRYIMGLSNDELESLYHDYVMNGTLISEQMNGDDEDDFDMNARRMDEMEALSGTNLGFYEDILKTMGLSLDDLSFDLSKMSSSRSDGYEHIGGFSINSNGFSPFGIPSIDKDAIVKEGIDAIEKTLGVKFNSSDRLNVDDLLMRTINGEFTEQELAEKLEEIYSKGNSTNANKNTNHLFNKINNQSVINLLSYLEEVVRDRPFTEQEVSSILLEMKSKTNEEIFNGVTAIILEKYNGLPITTIGQIVEKCSDAFEFKSEYIRVEEQIDRDNQIMHFKVNNRDFIVVYKLDHTIKKQIYKYIFSNFK